MSGFVFYDGVSAIDNQTPIVGIATLQTENRKTGPVVQTWIMSRDDDPVALRNDGEEYPVCGDCPLQGNQGCYVILGQAPLAIWEAYHRGRYPIDVDLRCLHGRVLRMGSYGDPTAIPLATWRPMMRASYHWLAYTHNWRRCHHRWKYYAMASVHNETEAIAAHKRGWRTFRVTRPGNRSLLPNETVCPSPRVKCDKCRLCDGMTASRKAYGVPSIVIAAHGPTMGRMLHLLS
jgi:hypothetical protein